MSEFVNTIDLLGDDVVMNSIIDRSITEFKDNKVTSIGQYAFYGCTALANVDLPNVTTLNGEVFNNCTSLVNIALPNVTRLAGKSIFQSCKSLKKIRLPEALNIPNYTFHSCTNLEIIDLPKLTSIAWDICIYCTALKAFILRNDETVCTVAGTNAFSSSGIGKKTGYIYVPSALYDEYIVATNWSTFASQFRKLEDYTVDGTTTGELDESKI